MARFAYLFTAFASIASATIFTPENIDAHLATLEKRQDPKTQCHMNCGFAIRDARQAGYCDNSTWVDNFNGCMQCAVEQDIWSMYGNSVTNAGTGCGLEVNPVGLATDGGVASSAAASASGVVSSAAAAASSAVSEAAAVSSSVAGALSSATAAVGTAASEAVASASGAAESAAASGTAQAGSSGAITNSPMFANVVVALALLGLY